MALLLGLCKYMEFRISGQIISGFIFGISALWGRCPGFRCGQAGGAACPVLHNVGVLRVFLAKRKFFAGFLDAGPDGAVPGKRAIVKM